MKLLDDNAMGAARKKTKEKLKHMSEAFIEIAEENKMKKQWLELNITINGFQYAVREEVNNLKDIEQQGIQLSSRLYDLINKRETTTSQCKIKPGAEYITLNNKGKFLSNKLPQEWEDEIFEYEQHSENYLKLKSQTLKSILVRKEDIIQL